MEMKFSARSKKKFLVYFKLHPFDFRLFFHPPPDDDEDDDDIFAIV